MRIVGGEWRGRRIEAPTGRDTRPTTDRTREAMASMLMSACDLSLEGERILDAFAGSGAITFELLSRGAEGATLVDRSRKAISLIKNNARALGAEHLIEVVCGSVSELVERGRIATAGRPFTILVLDPPYAMTFSEVQTLIHAMREAKVLAPDALVLYESAASGETPELAGATILKQKTYGDTAVTLYRMHDADADDAS